MATGMQRINIHLSKISRMIEELPPRSEPRYGLKINGIRSSLSDLKKAMTDESIANEDLSEEQRDIINKAGKLT